MRATGGTIQAVKTVQNFQGAMFNCISLEERVPPQTPLAHTAGRSRCAAGDDGWRVRGGVCPSRPALGAAGAAAQGAIVADSVLHPQRAAAGGGDLPGDFRSS